VTDISATKVNEVYMRVEAPGKTRRELSDYFSFAIPGAQFSEAAKKGWWDGRKRLYDSLVSKHGPRNKATSFI
jgi:hypothetical protein